MISAIRIKFKEKLETDTRNLIDALRGPYWNGRDLVIIAHQVVDDINRLDLCNFMEKYYPDPRIREQALVEATGSHDIGNVKGHTLIDALLKFGSIDERAKSRALEIDSLHDEMEKKLKKLNDAKLLAKDRNVTAAHGTFPIPLGTGIRAVGIAFSFLAEREEFDQSSLPHFLVDSFQPRPLAQKDSRFSTGAAIKKISELLCQELRQGSIKTVEELRSRARDIANDERGTMVGFEHFVKIGEGYPLSEATSPIEAANYIEDYCRYMDECKWHVGSNLSNILLNVKRVCLSEYSRAIFTGLMTRISSSRIPLEIVLASRSEQEVPEENDAAIRFLKSIGANIILKSQAEWISFLRKLHNGQEQADMVLFGAEAITYRGDIVFPQRIPPEELALIEGIATKQSGEVKIVCVAEAYKVLSRIPSHEEEVRNVLAKGRYCTIPASCISLYVTNLDEFGSKQKEQQLNSLYRSSIESARKILDQRSATMRGMPFSYMPDNVLNRVSVIAIDIDDTLTNDGKLPSQIVDMWSSLKASGLVTIMITHRSAGWGQRRLHDLPSIDLVLAENGAVVCDKNGSRPFLANRALLLQTAAVIEARFGLLESDDSQFRVGEITFRKPDKFSSNDLEIYSRLVPDELEILADTDSLHLRPRRCQKADTLREELKDTYSMDQVLIIGDGPDDSQLFRFPISVGVSGVKDYQKELGENMPRYITLQPGGDGFLEVANRLLELKQEFFLTADTGRIITIPS